MEYNIGRILKTVNALLAEDMNDEELLLKFLITEIAGNNLEIEVLIEYLRENKGL